VGAVVTQPARTALAVVKALKRKKSRRLNFFSLILSSSLIVVQLKTIKRAWQLTEMTEFGQ
jgi:hypothetical protein